MGAQQTLVLRKMHSKSILIAISNELHITLCILLGKKNEPKRKESEHKTYDLRLLQIYVPTSIFF